MSSSLIVDLRSDTVTRPSEGMRAAMASAVVGDDVFSDDPTVNSLEERVAAMFGKEAALFAPTGSMANQLGLRLLVKPGEELLCDVRAHVARAELGAAAVISGITTRTWNSVRGKLIAQDALALAHPNAGPYLVSTTAIAVENTHNFGGGTVQSMDEIKKLRGESQKLGIAMHLDGARLWNAHIKAGFTFQEIGSYFDTISVCLSKGLGAPVGSILISSKERITESRIWRKRLGGGMRQVGILAAAGHYALDHNIERIADDHRRAARIAQELAQIAPQAIAPVETNIVLIDLSGSAMDAATFVNEAKTRSVWVSALGPNSIRLITHLDVDDRGVEQACDVLGNLLHKAFVAK